MALYPKTRYQESQQAIIEAIMTLAAHNIDVEVVWLYGSRAQNTAHAESDYDLAIAFKNFQLDQFDKYLRPNELALSWAQQLGLPSDKLSIIDINQAPIYLAYNVVEYGNVIYHSHTSRELHEQDRINSMYEFQIREAEEQAFDE
ncbi:MAG: type VII toxin-antitoxin system MntA family adenylyltransferase antitoxin [Vibrio sp.]|uniref:type VII toxin-antitoxin system MntA family adenylyltransferase antitoxin n=1 Tax=Vibrio sp. TaxID=678 RepID=UPI003A86E495